MIKARTQACRLLAIKPHATHAASAAPCQWCMGSHRPTAQMAPPQKGCCSPCLKPKAEAGPGPRARQLPSRHIGCCGPQLPRSIQSPPLLPHRDHACQALPGNRRHFKGSVVQEPSRGSAAAYARPVVAAAAAVKRAAQYHLGPVHVLKQIIYQHHPAPTRCA